MSLIEDSRTAASATSGAPTFLIAGAPTAGTFRCAECGYGIAVRALLPICRMCRGFLWDDPTTSPYGRPPL